MSEALHTPSIHNPERTAVRAARGTTEFMDNVADKIDAFADRWAKRRTLKQTISDGAEAVKGAAYDTGYDLQETYLTKKEEAGEWIDNKVESVKDTGSRAVEAVVAKKDAAKELFENFRDGVRERKAARHERWAARAESLKSGAYNKAYDLQEAFLDTAEKGKEFTVRQKKRAGRAALSATMTGVSIGTIGAYKAREAAGHASEKTRRFVDRSLENRNTAPAMDILSQRRKAQAEKLELKARRLQAQAEALRDKSAS